MIKFVPSISAKFSPFYKHIFWSRLNRVNFTQNSLLNQLHNRYLKSIRMNYHRSSFGWNHRLPRRNFKSNWRTCSSTGNNEGNDSPRAFRRNLPTSSSSTAQNTNFNHIKETNNSKVSNNSSPARMSTSSSGLANTTSSSSSTSTSGNCSASNNMSRTIPTMEQLLQVYPLENRPYFYEYKLKELDKPGQAVWNFKSICSLLSEQSRQGLHSHVFRPPTYDYFESAGGWCCKLTVFHPYNTYFLVTQSSKKKAEEHACKQALIWFRDQDVM